MKRWLLALLTACALLACGAAAAEDVCFISDVAGSSGVTTGSSYLQLRVPVEEEAQVLLTIAGENDRLVYQRDFGLCAGPFRTEEIYLKLQGASTVYHITLQVGETVYAFPVERVAGRLNGSAACTAGLPLSELSGADGWRMATILPVQDGETTVPVVAGGAYTVGTATFRMQAGKLTVTVALSDAVDGVVDSGKIFVATDATVAAQLGRSKFPGLTGKLNKPIDLGDAAYVAVYVNMMVSFDPSGAAAAPSQTDANQQAWWLKLVDSGDSVG